MCVGVLLFLWVYLHMYTICTHTYKIIFLKMPFGKLSYCNFKVAIFNLCTDVANLFHNIRLFCLYNINNILSHCILIPVMMMMGIDACVCDAANLCLVLITGSGYDMESDPYQFIFWLLLTLVIHADLEISLSEITEETYSQLPQASCHVADMEGPSVFKEKPESKPYDQRNWILSKLICLVQQKITIYIYDFHSIWPTKTKLREIIRGDFMTNEN